MCIRAWLATTTAPASSFKVYRWGSVYRILGATNPHAERVPTVSLLLSSYLLSIGPDCIHTM
jgi:hypothetical protein